MCRHRMYSQKNYNLRQYKFQKHFRAYLIVNAILAFMAIGGNDLDGWFPVAFFWGLGVLIHYLKVYGNAPSPKRSLSMPLVREEDLVRDEPESRWREQDLV